MDFLKIIKIVKTRFLPLILVVLSIIAVVDYKTTNNIIDNIIIFLFNKDIEKLETKKYKIIKTLISLIPIVVLIYLDLTYSTLSMKNLLVTNFLSNNTINYILRVGGIFGIVLVLSQDIGIESAEFQKKIVSIPIVHAFLLMGSAFALTHNRSESLLGALLYFYTRRILSNNKVMENNISNKHNTIADINDRSINI